MNDVAMGIILNSQGRILIAQRNQKKNFGGLWEFPGGKLESGESPSTALIRELKEELSIKVEILKIYDHYTYLGDNIDINFYPIQCSVVKGEISNNEHEQIEFVEVGQIGSYTFAPPDYIAVELIKKEYKDMLIRSCS